MPDSTDSNTSVDSASTAESRSEVLNQVQDDNADTGVSISRPPSLALMYGLSAGHGVKHFGQGALLIMIPSIRATFGLSDIAIGGIWS
ncbi:MAG: hypothetical protein J4O07_10695, partial [Chloroflexi bacterium]|nr:hypothetical protein [Chloroflexota bacterium]